MAVQLRDSDGTVRLSGDLLASGGATGDVLTQQADGTYAPAVGGAAPITRAQYDVALNAVAQNTPTKMPLVFNYGTALLDLVGTPDFTPVESATYSFAVTVAITSLAPGAGWSLAITLDQDDFSGTLSASQTTPFTTASQVVTFPFYVPAGSPCYVQVTHDANDVGGVNFSGHVYVQRQA